MRSALKSVMSSKRDIRSKLGTMSKSNGKVGDDPKCSLLLPRQAFQVTVLVVVICQQIKVVVQANQGLQYEGSANQTGAEGDAVL
mmetsp:Transcript_33898/g.59089  ORF Transcript_33898/g.59089 Transcript_33898/m.59089 type:complete len:85 (-) Transcript_33898:182-436(-)